MCTGCTVQAVIVHSPGDTDTLYTVQSPVTAPGAPRRAAAFYRHSEVLNKEVSLEVSLETTTTKHYHGHGTY